ncbi:hypothetical protein H5410_024551 [Solanum commersonii]|uniref:Uncharacterized protein n=1 Tax=Solanum commersonii TaxID=4109 RepID=A0A9J5ZMB4_SOLCO|nr:hypothetical protein H5410_024551 [Solanum commersonii]
MMQKEEKMQQKLDWLNVLWQLLVKPRFDTCEKESPIAQFARIAFITNQLSLASGLSVVERQMGNLSSAKSAMQIVRLKNAVPV